MKTIYTVKSVNAFIPNTQNQQQVSLSPELEMMFISILQCNDQFRNKIKSEISKIEKEKKIKQPHVRESKFTSTGKPKAEAADPIRATEDIKKIQNYFLDKEDYRDYQLFTVGISIGLRISDLVSLKFSDVMYNDYTFKSNINIVELKTGKRSSDVSDDCLLTKTVTDAIELYMCSLEHKPDMSDYLFRSQKGDCLDTRSAIKILKNMSRNLGLDKKYNISSHTLRKTFAYWVIKLNPNDMRVLISLQMMLKHSDLRTTFKYAGITKDDTRAMRNGLSDFYESEL